jgi:STAM-binding protein
LCIRLSLAARADYPSQASFALSEGDYGRAYMMLYRHSVLVLNSLPKHPQYKEPESRKTCKALERRIDRVLVDLEKLKPAIEAAYREWERMQPLNEPPPPPPSTDRPRSYADFAARDPTLTGNARILDASEHQDLAVDLAQKELRRRDTARRATRQAGVSDEETTRRRRAGHWDDWDRSTMISSDVDLQKQMEAARWNLDHPSATRDSDREGDTYDTSAPQSSASHYSYPSINKSRPVAYDRSQSHTSLPPPLQPQRPPKERMQSASGGVPRASDAAPPVIPRKVTLDETYKPMEPQSPWRPGSPAPDLPPKQTLDVPTSAPPPPKKERLTFKPGAYLENGDPIRSVFLPRSLRRSFLELAANNTKKGLEMCGILCGTPVNNALFIRCLVIPDQKCTSDTCETENESAVFDFCESEDLMMIGWIHTHPTQSCFMSSRDLHTHAGYQIMMPESVAIVCAPKFEPS